jgi:hypothetical protein
MRMTFLAALILWRRPVDPGRPDRHLRVNGGRDPFAVPQDGQALGTTT